MVPVKPFTDSIVMVAVAGLPIVTTAAEVATIVKSVTVKVAVAG